MLKRLRKPKWSLTIMRDASQSVKQVRFSRQTAIIAPTMLLVTIAGTVAALQLRAESEIRQLEHKLAKQSAIYQEQIESMYTRQVEETQESQQQLTSLQSKVRSQTREIQHIEKRLAELVQLEKKLRLFIEKYGQGTIPSTTNAPLIQQNPETIRQDIEQQLSSISSQTDLDINRVTGLIDSLESAMSQTLRLAEQRRSQVDEYPSGWPTAKLQLTSGFGYRKDPFTGKAAFHAGIDIAGKTGDAVFSAADGTVIDTGFNRIYGNYVFISHKGNLQTSYFHLDKLETKKGERVVKGEKIGLLGNTGRSTGAHLHFQIIQENKTVNPLPYLKLEAPHS